MFGLSFLEKEPKHFECKHIIDGQEVWQSCSKEYICANALDQNDYRPDKNDDEYFDNWVPKFNLLCEDKMKIGLIGTVFFVGVIVSMLIVPPLADWYGRKIIVLISFFISCAGQTGLLFTNNLYEAYVYQFLIGASFAGRIIVGLSYVLEFNLKKYADPIITALLFSESTGVILITLWY